MLVESESDLKTLRRIVDNGASASRPTTWARCTSSPAATAPPATGSPARPSTSSTRPPLGLFAGLGATRWSPRPRCRPQIAELRAGLGCDIEVELFAHGRLPLAYSARCFTARHYNLQKDSCAFRCLEFADGIPLKTRGARPSHPQRGSRPSRPVTPLLADLPAVVADGLDLLRISPQGEHTGEIIRLFPAAPSTASSRPLDALHRTPSPAPRGTVQRLQHGRPGVEQLVIHWSAHAPSPPSLPGPVARLGARLPQLPPTSPSSAGSTRPRPHPARDTLPGPSPASACLKVTDAGRRCASPSPRAASARCSTRARRPDDLRHHPRLPRPGPPRGRPGHPLLQPPPADGGRDRPRAAGQNTLDAVDWDALTARLPAAAPPRLTACVAGATRAGPRGGPAGTPHPAPGPPSG